MAQVQTFVARVALPLAMARMEIARSLEEYSGTCAIKITSSQEASLVNSVKLRGRRENEDRQRGRLFDFPQHQ